MPTVSTQPQFLMTTWPCHGSVDSRTITKGCTKSFGTLPGKPTSGWPVLDRKVKESRGPAALAQTKSHADVANALLGDLRRLHDDNVVGCFGAIFTESDGVWTKMDLGQIAGTLVAYSRFDGTPYCSRYSDYHAVAKLMYQACADEEFFLGSANGIAVDGNFYRVRENWASTLKCSVRNIVVGSLLTWRRNRARCLYSMLT